MLFYRYRFLYAPALWLFYSKILNHRVNNIYERTLRSVCKNFNSSYDDLQAKSFRTHHCNLRKIYFSKPFKEK